MIKHPKTGNTLKAGIRREELGSASDPLSSDPNACPLISTFSKPHSEVASTTHIPALKGSFLVLLKTEGLPTNAGFTNAVEGELFRQKRTSPQPEETHKARETSPVNDKIHFAGRIL